MGIIARIKGEEPGIIKKIPHAFQGKGHYGEYLTEYALEHGSLGNIAVCTLSRIVEGLGMTFAEFFSDE